MRRFLGPILLALTVAAALDGGLAACTESDTTTEVDPRLDAGARKDGSPVEPPEAGASDAAPPPQPVPSCEKYCTTVLQACSGDQAQYASKAECVALCERLPVGEPGEQDTNTLACRAIYAGTPAKSDPAKYCVAAGPFGGGLCGDRCNAFCQLAVAVCPAPGAGPYPAYPDCATACASFAYRDAGADGGGETPEGPTSGDTLNCRLYQLREVVRTGAGCADIGADSGACRW